MLIRLEDTIIFALIERAQFAHNPRIYQPGAWLDWFIKETESFHAKARRYCSPDEYPFTPIDQLPEPVLDPFIIPRLLHANNVNVNPSILSFYVYSIVPAISRQASLTLSASRRAVGIKGAEEYDDDDNYGSATTIDVQILQAISKRVHYGKFVSESKFRDHPADFVPHILNPNREVLEALITKPAVERALLERLSVHDLYEKYIIPLTKEVEVDYLLQRLDGLSPEQIEALRTSKGGIPPEAATATATSSVPPNIAMTARD
ncbi:chorismate mutase [Auriculariales sp. MPI-PUGE-AT-0066]|nr:chorismate mutase [Auriculariales sp. MPI-PUGE-AT-0066]